VPSGAGLESMGNADRGLAGSRAACARGRAAWGHGHAGSWDAKRCVEGESNLSPATVNRRLAAIRPIVALAQLRGLVDR
jgi:hypothetical protein